MKVKVLALIIISTLYGCKTTNDKVTPSNNKQVEEQLMVTASTIDDSLHTLAQAQAQAVEKEQVINTAPLLTEMAGLSEIISIDWSGPIQPLLEQLGELAQYKVKVIGKQPAIPVIVTLDVNNVTVADVIKDAGLQVSNRASIVVYPANKIIELRYK